MKPPFLTTGLHPNQILALRDHKALTQDEFATLFGVAGRQVKVWETDGVSTGPTAVAVRAVAEAWSFTFPIVESTHGTCEICGSDGYHEVDRLDVCRSCYFTPTASMLEIGYQVSVEDEREDAMLEVKAPPARSISLPPTMFGPEDWKTEVRKRLGTTEFQTGFADFDDTVFIGYIEPETEVRLKDQTIRLLIADLVPHGQLELIGDAARLNLFRRNERPHEELVLRLGLLMSRLCENA